MFLPQTSAGLFRLLLRLRSATRVALRQAEETTIQRSRAKTTERWCCNRVGLTFDSLVVMHNARRMWHFYCHEPSTLNRSRCTIFCKQECFSLPLLFVRLKHTLTYAPEAATGGIFFLSSPSRAQRLILTIYIWDGWWIVLLHTQIQAVAIDTTRTTYTQCSSLVQILPPSPSS